MNGYDADSQESTLLERSPSVPGSDASLVQDLKKTKVETKKIDGNHLHGGMPQQNPPACVMRE